MESVKRKLQGLIEQRDEAEDRAAKIQSDLLAERKLREEVRGFISSLFIWNCFFPLLYIHNCKKLTWSRWFSAVGSRDNACHLPGALFKLPRLSLQNLTYLIS